MRNFESMALFKYIAAFGLPMFEYYSYNLNLFQDNDLSSTATVGQSGESGKLLPGKFDHFEGNYDFSHTEYIRQSGKFVGNVNFFPGNLHFFQPWSSVPNFALKSPPIKTMLCTGISLSASDKFL